MLNFEVQNTLAKLLARENVSVQHGNYPTAYFDVEKRVLGLPLWKDRGKDVYDLLVGHEVGHALFTPAEGWHQSVVDLGLPRAYVNVIEDIRIEKLIQAKYPGLVSSFKRGYKVLSDEDFFGLTRVDSVNQLGLIDRINVKAKLRDLVEVEFSAEEQPLVDMAFAVTTFEDVLEVCKALYAYMKEQYENNDKDETDAGESSSEGLGDDSDSSDDASSQDPTGFGDEDADEEGGSDSEDQQESGEQNIRSEEESSEEGEQSTEQVATDGAGDPDRVFTDEAFRSSEESLLEADANGYQPTYVKALTRKQVNDAVTGYKEILAIRAATEEANESRFGETFAEFDAEYVEFKSETKKFVNLMGKEFEMRKAAYQNLRAQSARSGSLDVNKLHSYKYSDDIFMRVTQLADAKSHGMVMFIDFSGSMNNILKDTIKQCLTLASFCKKVNIPFDVYSFTSGMKEYEHPIENGQIDHNNLSIIQLLSSQMSKHDFEVAYKQLFNMGLSCSHGIGRLAWSSVEGLGGTPLNETIMASRFILRDFKKKHGVQKVNAVFLTDGESQSFYHRNTSDMKTRGYAIDIDGKVITARHNRKLTDDLIKNLGREFNVIGYYLCERSYDFRSQVWTSVDEFLGEEDMNRYRKQYNKNKFIALDNARGYSRYFIVKAEGKSLDTDAEEFSVSDDAKKGEIARAFKKFTSSKKANRMLATQFAEMVA